ncbi:H(+)/Cl(-) exchange transporter 3 (Chloride channel protein 3) (ClC-3) (Chloride transporter ClC-3) [Durusdinium trenchii]|uniref:H(+)/Cl(-) exchange transporter 3 (Chloride channel protein 3) (ClC-3) (Chloride transporter ClC-3) n=1 Tax=Durusdinium trenchii TaxID=1381693 RepID=A0ABP0H5H8_9DINO
MAMFNGSVQSSVAHQSPSKEEDGTGFSPTTFGKSTAGEIVEHFNKERTYSSSSAEAARRKSRVQAWRKRLVGGLKKPWRRQQQQPSWETVRTVELHEEEKKLIAQKQAHGCLLSWCWAIQNWFLAASVGALCYATYVLIEVSVGALSSFRFGFCQAEPFRSEEHCPKGQWISWGVNLLGFAASVVLGTWMAAASAFLVSRFAPAASGSGIPEVKTILNGFVLPDVATFRTLFIKVPCLILAVASGLSLGHEGPMVHVGVCWANLLSRLFPQFRNEGKRQQLFSAAVAAGVSSAFGTPVGGVLFSLEEVVATLLLSVSNLTGTGHLTLYSVTYTVTLHPSDYAMFALLGAAGGLVGALFNALNIRWCAFKAKASFRKWVGPVQEASFLAFLTLLSSWPLSLTRYLNAQTIHALLDTCSDEPGETVRSRLQAEFGLCTEDGYSNSSGNGLLTSLGFAAAIRFCQTVLTIGTACPAGLFVPSLFIGACLGRCLALGLKALNTGTRLFPHKIDPGVYSMVGAASVLGGVSRMTISLVVIMLELTGGLDYIVPFMISVLLAKAVGDSLNEGIYDLQIVLKGYPFLHEELDVTFTERCCDIMETGLVKLDLNLRPRLQDLRVMVRAFTFRGFPIVDGDFFVGYVRRSQLEDVLARMELVRGQNEVISLDDLLPVVDTTVMRMVPNAPLTQAHQVFKQLGCQRIFLVGSMPGGQQDVLQGIITKKNFLKFLQDGTVGHIPDELRLAGSQMESNGASALRFSYEGPQQESTASHIRLGELFSVLDAAAEAGGEQRTEDQLSWAPSASDDEAHQRHEANGSPLSVGTGQPGP